MDAYFREIEIAFENMIDAGWDMSQEKIWEFYFYGETQDKLQQFAQLMEPDGFTLEFLGTDGNENGLTLSLSRVFQTPKDIYDFELILDEKASQFGIEYDGWDASDGEEEEDE